jgi:NAD(P)-dependent dehydrogenase (short-subunit alcohol dehydrogenase family)
MISASLAGKKILITDALHFAGPGAVPGLLELGAEVLCHDDGFGGAKAREDFQANHPAALIAETSVPTDLAAEAIERLGHVDVLIHNDAFPAKKMPIEMAGAEDLRQALDRLVVRGFDLTGRLTTHMKERGAGKVIFLTSAAPIGGMPNYTAYAAARGAANALIKSLALELAPHNIQVNAIAPNFLDNPDYYPKELMDRPDLAKRVLSQVPLGRLGEQEEAAALIAFLAGDHSGFITGQVIPFAGGWA